MLPQHLGTGLLLKSTIFSCLCGSQPYTDTHTGLPQYIHTVRAMYLPRLVYLKKNIEVLLISVGLEIKVMLIQLNLQ